MKKKFVLALVALAASVGLSACGATIGGDAGKPPGNIKSYDVVDQHGSRHVCFENTDTGALSCG